jgi:hypothetical protein
VVDTSDRIRAAVDERGLLLVHDQVLPSVTALIAGAPIEGSWWSHPMANTIYNALGAIESDVAMVKLIAGKNTLVAKRLWPDLRDIGIGRDPWQTNRLDDEAIALLDDINDATAPYWSTNHGRKSRPCWSAGCWSIRLRYTPPPAITGRPTKDGNDGVMSGISARPRPLRRHGRPSRPSLRNRPTRMSRNSFCGEGYLLRSSSGAT